ncbi:MAG: AAA family ATPase [Gammaproteobacteria bacterium]|nr:AAA family ATPase [Gammaproteobacteria bacterium]
MYLEHFGLTDNPFTLISDPRYLYLSKMHARVKAYIEYATQVQDSLVIFTGEIGTGKTTLIADAVSRMAKNIVVAKIHQTKLSDTEFLQAILQEFGADPQGTERAALHTQLRKHFVEIEQKGKKALLVIDEAQNLDPTLFEEIRFLIDLEYKNKKLVNIVLLGQPELNEVIDAPNMENLMQRVRLRAHIGPLASWDILAYINHRLKIAGAAPSAEIFSESTIPVIFEYTGGRPRAINILCDYALTTAFIEHQYMVTETILRTAISELQWVPYEKKYGAMQMQSPPSKNRKLPASIVVRHENSFVGKFLVDKEFLNIGRKSDNDIVLEDPLVSRHHAQIFTKYGTSFLRDLNSANGIFIEDLQIELQELLDGLTFKIGSHTLTYQTEEIPQKENDTDFVNGRSGKILQYPHQTVPARIVR